ncbi:hypothetical protein BVG79_00011 [Ketogulonicigenium robustum]|uniref:Uncharacterized protein n=1 Tax=Ketogulonicigenium robustum TaxID=92947 RepID=A0A1W6NW59_9RHOB|nr:hypothetical protein BVG79_00011 [Ketogulonicigenium robustum]
MEALGIAVIGSQATHSLGYLSDVLPRVGVILLFHLSTLVSA